MKELLLKAFKNHAEGEIRKHVANIEVFLNHPVGVAEHPDTIETIGKEMEALADWDDKLEMANKYF